MGTSDPADIVERLLALRLSANSHMGTADDAAVAELAAYRACFPTTS